MNLLQTVIGENTTISGAAFWAFAGAAVAISFWIQRTIQGVKDELNGMSKDFSLRMQAIEMKMDGNLKRSEFQRFLSLNPTLARPEEHP